MTKFENEVELKKYLDKFGLRYGDDMPSTNIYICTFTDNKSGSELHQQTYKTPIAAVRDYNKVLEATKFPLDDVDLVLHGVLIKGKSEYVYLNIALSPYLYFKKSDSKKTSKK